MIVVTGPTGHVGINLVRALLAQDRRVRALVYEPSEILDGLPVEQVRGDVTNRESLISAFEGAETVFHLAARIDLTRRHVALCHRINVEGTRNVIEACARRGVGRLVYFSSIHAISPFPIGESIDERRPLAAAPYLGVYDETKALATAEVLRACGEGLDAVVLHPTGIIGPEDYQPSRMGRTLVDFARGRIPALIGGGFSWVDVRDVCEAALRAERRGLSGARYLLSGHFRSMLDLARMAAGFTGAAAPRGVLPHRLARAIAAVAEGISGLRGTEPAFSRYSIDALRHHGNLNNAMTRRALDWKPRPLEETVRDTLQWHEDRGNLRASAA